LLKESGVEVTVYFEAQLRNIAGTGQAKISLPSACSVAEALRIVAGKFGSALGERLLTADEKPQRSILLFVNDQAVAHDLAGTHQLKSGDTLLLYPPISGG